MMFYVLFSCLLFFTHMITCHQKLSFSFTCRRGYPKVKREKNIKEDNYTKVKFIKRKKKIDNLFIKKKNRRCRINH